MVLTVAQGYLVEAPFPRLDLLEVASNDEALPRLYLEPELLDIRDHPADRSWIYVALDLIDLDRVD